MKDVSGELRVLPVVKKISNEAMFFLYELEPGLLRNLLSKMYIFLVISKNYTGTVKFT